MENNLKKKQKKKSKWFKYFFFNFVKVTGAIPVWLWLRNKYYYENSNAKQKVKKGALIIANHRGFIDPVVMHSVFWYRNLHFIMAKEVMSNKFLKWFLPNILCIPIDRENVSMRSFKEIIDTLKQGKAVGIFPEGHIINNKADELDPFKSGAVLMAAQANVPIIPMVIIRRKKWWQRQKVVLGEPITINTSRPTLKDITDISQMLHEKELELMKIYKKRNKK